MSWHDRTNYVLLTVQYDDVVTVRRRRENMVGVNMFLSDIKFKHGYYYMVFKHGYYY